MSPYSTHSSGDRNEVVLPANSLTGGRTTWYQEDPIRVLPGVSPRVVLRQVQTYNKYINHAQIRQGRTMGTDFGNLRRAIPPMVQKDTFLDNELGRVVSKTKTKFGKSHFVEAYKRVLNTSKKIDDEWEKYLAEEVRQRSLLEAGEE